MTKGNMGIALQSKGSSLVFFRKCDGTSSNRGRWKLSCIRHGPWLKDVYSRSEVVDCGLWVVGVVVCEFGKPKSRMSDLKKCRLGNLSNKGKLLVRECMLLDENPLQRA
jgi:hypothetical protein